MASTTIQPKNAKVAFSGKPFREKVPAAAASREKLPAAPSSNALEAKTSALRKRGLISDKQADKLQPRKG